MAPRIKIKEKKWRKASLTKLNKNDTDNYTIKAGQTKSREKIVTKNEVPIQRYIKITHHKEAEARPACICLT